MDINTLLQEIYQASSNDKSNLFLPICVVELRGDPWNIGSLNMGDLATIDANLPSKICNAVSANNIASPSTATMTLSAIKFAGLSNAVMDQPTVSGNDATIKVNFGKATIPKGLTAPSALNISGNFAIDISCCPSSDGKTCSSPSQKSPVTGQFAITLANSSAEFALTISSDFSTTTINSIGFSSDVDNASFEVTPPLSPSINALLNTAFGTSAGQTAIVNCIKSAFTNSVLTSLGQTLSPIVSTTANPTILSFIANSLSGIANKPGNQYYLPDQLKDATNPTIEPYDIDGTWNIPDASSFYPSAGMTICSAIGTQASPPQTDISTPSSAVPIDISKVVINGASNAFAFPILVSHNTLSALAVFGQVSGWSPPNISIDGDFVLTVSCCESKDFKTCSGPSSKSQGQGTFNANIKNCSIVATIDITTKGTDLVATVSELEMFCDPNLIDPTNVVFTIDIHGIPDSDVWSKQAAKIFNSSSGTGAIINNINEQFKGKGVREQLSTIITNAINSLVGEEREELLMQINQTQKNLMS